MINTSLLVVVLMFAMVNVAYTQESADTTFAVSARGVADSDDSEIKKEMSNSPDADLTAPDYKNEGKSSRGALNYTTFDNHTPWYIRVYVNGTYQGTMRPWGDYSVRLPSSGSYRLYAKAVFDDGSYKYWGGISRFINGGFTWNLHP